MNNKILNLKELRNRYGASTKTIKLWAEGLSFPKPIKVNGINRWVAEELDKWDIENPRLYSMNTETFWRIIEEAGEEADNYGMMAKVIAGKLSGFDIPDIMYWFYICVEYEDLSTSIVDAIRNMAYERECRHDWNQYTRYLRNFPHSDFPSRVLAEGKEFFNDLFEGSISLTENELYHFVNEARYEDNIAEAAFYALFIKKGISIGSDMYYDYCDYFRDIFGDKQDMYPLPMSIVTEIQALNQGVVLTTSEN